MIEKQPTARMRLRTWIRDELTGKAEVSITDLRDRAVTYLLGNKELLQVVAKELLRGLIYEEIRLVVAESRGVAGRDGSVLLGDDLVTRERLKERSLKLSRAWDEWLEHAGDRHILVMEMDANDLQLAEDERRARGDVEYELADLWATLRGRLAPGQKVRDVWTVAEIEAARVSLKKPVAEPQPVAAT
jgi:hypothetical protein